MDISNTWLCFPKYNFDRKAKRLLQWKLKLVHDVGVSRLRLRQQNIPPSNFPFPPPPPLKIVVLGTRLGNKFCSGRGSEKVPTPYHFSNGPSLIVYFSRDIWSVCGVLQPHSEPMSTTEFYFRYY